MRMTAVGAAGTIGGTMVDALAGRRDPIRAGDRRATPGIAPAAPNSIRANNHGAMPRAVHRGAAGPLSAGEALEAPDLDPHGALPVADTARACFESARGRRGGWIVAIPDLL